MTNINTSDIREVLEGHYTRDKYTLAFEVSMGTRYADAVAICLWPSQGYNIQGFEIKVSRGDWLRELKNPAKADAMAKYCDRWWVITPPGIVKTGELPDTWGLMEVVEGKLNVVSRAEKREATPVNREFMVSMLRRGDQIDDNRLRKAVQLKTEALAKEAQQLVERERTRLKHEYDPMIEVIRDAEAKTGLRLRWMLDSEKLVALMRVTHRLGLDDGDFQGLSSVATELRHASKSAGELAEKIDAAGVYLQGKHTELKSEEVPS
jgi:hypothetical protein